MDHVALIQEVLPTAQTILIVLPEKLTFDRVASALALFLALKKIPKEVGVITRSPMTVEYASLVGVDKVTDKLTGKDLVVSFDYKEDAIEKVSYHIENDKFNLVIQAKEGKKPLDSSKVEYRYTGSTADMIIAMGVKEISGLGSMYTENKERWDKAKSVCFSDEGMISCAEMVSEVLSRLRLPMDEDIANNLLAALKKSSQNFTAAGLQANMFEAVAFCLRSGASWDKKTTPAGGNFTFPEKKEDQAVF